MLHSNTQANISPPPVVLAHHVMAGTEIIGYAEPWIVSPGEPVNIKACFLSCTPGPAALANWGQGIEH